MRGIAIVALLSGLALAQGQPGTYKKEWEEVSVLQKMRDQKAKKEVSVARIKFVHKHRLAQCIGVPLRDALFACPSARMFVSDETRLTGVFPGGDPWHLHVVRADGSETAWYPESDARLTLIPEELVGGTHLVCVSSRYTVTVQEEGAKPHKMRTPPYVVAVALERGRDPISEGTAQPLAQAGSNESGAVVAEARPVSDSEFALGVWHEGEAGIVVGSGEYLLNPRLTLAGEVKSGESRIRQHVGIYPMPPGTERGTLEVWIGKELFALSDFPAVRVESRVPEEVAGTETEVEGKVDRVRAKAGVAVRVQEFSGAMGKDVNDVTIQTVDATAEGGWKTKLTGEGETFYWVRAWTPWKRRGGMMGCSWLGSMRSMGREYKAMVDPGPHFRVVRFKGTQKLAEADSVLGDWAKLLGQGLIAGALWQRPGSNVTRFPGNVTYNQLEQGGAYFISSGGGGGGGGGGPGGPPPPKKRDPRFEIVSVDPTPVDCGKVHVDSELPGKVEVKVVYLYDDGDDAVTTTATLKLSSANLEPFSISTGQVSLVEAPNGKGEFKFTVEFQPKEAKKYEKELAFTYFDAKGNSRVVRKVPLKGEGIRDARLYGAFAFGTDDPFKEINRPGVGLENVANYNFGAVDLGTAASSDRIFLHVLYEDGSDDRKTVAEVNLKWESEDASFRLTQPKTSFKTPEGRKRYLVTIIFAPRIVRPVSAKLRATGKSADGKLTFVSDLNLEGKGKTREGSESGAAPSGTIPTTALLAKPKAVTGTNHDLIVVDKDGGGRFVPAGETYVLGPTPPPAIIFVPQTGEGPRFVWVPEEPGNTFRAPPECPDITPPDTTPSVDVPTGSVFTAVVPTIRLPEDPTVNLVATSAQGNQVQCPLSQIGTFETEQGEMAVYGGTRGQTLPSGSWELEDSEGQTVSTTQVIRWVSTGPKQIVREGVWKVAFAREGNGPKAKVRIELTGLSIVNVTGDIAEVQIQSGGKIATGTVAEGEPKVVVSFSADPGATAGNIAIREEK